MSGLLFCHPCFKAYLLSSHGFNHLSTYIILEFRLPIEYPLKMLEKFSNRNLFSLRNYFILIKENTLNKYDHVYNITGLNNNGLNLSFVPMLSNHPLKII